MPLTIRLSRHVLALLCIISPTLATAAAAPAPWMPRLTIAVPGERPVALESVRVRAEVTAGLAQTEVEMTFFNPNGRTLEGDLDFPLLDGQTIVGFALDVDGKLREAVPIEKSRGRAVFEDIARIRADPGLLQHTLGNNFRIRIYPMPPMGRRHVVLRYTETLAGNERQLRYRLPLDYGRQLDTLAVDIRVASSHAVPRMESSVLGRIPMQRQGGFYTARLERKRFTPHGVLDIEIPREPAAGTYAQTIEDRTYFNVDLPLQTRVEPRRRPRKVGIVWDASGSGANRNHAREFALLDQYLRWLGNADIRLAVIRDVPEQPRSFQVRNGNWTSLRTVLESMAYDGGTALGSIRPETDVDEHLVFSDGLSNFGVPPVVSTAQPLHVIVAASRTDVDWLRGTAHASGGQHIDLLAESVDDAAHRLATAGTRVVEVTGEGATDLVLRSPHPQHGRIFIAGRLTAMTGRIHITTEGPEGRRTTAHTIGNDAVVSGTAAAQWATMRIAQLSTRYDTHRAEILRLGSEFGLVTRETSLIVLERIQDYVRHEIMPPVELRPDYERLRQAANYENSWARKLHLDQIVGRFTEKVNWWRTSFPHRPPKPKNAQPSWTRHPLAELSERSDMALHRFADTLEPQAMRRVAPVAPSRTMPHREVARGSSIAKQRDTAPAGTVVSLVPFASDNPLVHQIRAAPADAVYALYLAERATYRDSVAFYLDVADVLFEKGLDALAVRVLSNLAEMNLEDRHILRVLGHRLTQAKRPELAVATFERVLALAPDEPQSYRDLGLALHATGHSQRAVDLLYEVVTRPWHDRFPDIELIANADLNAIVAQNKKRLDAGRIHPGLLHNLDVDLRIVLTWDADNTDIDLWVTDPAREKAYYGRPLTSMGGRMSQDFTGGYGPEEFALRKARPGTYRIEAHYYGDRRQRLTGPTTLQAKIYTNFGRPSQAERTITLRLRELSEKVSVGEIEISPTKAP